MPWWWPFGGVPEIGATELYQRLRAGSDIQLVDVRTDLEFRRGHIAGAKHAPIHSLARLLPALELDPAKPVVTICKTAHRSIPATRLLRDHGFDSFQLENGMDEWRRQNLPGGGVMKISTQRPPAEIAEQAWERLTSVDRRVLNFLAQASVPLLRISLGIVFVWFGVLKIVGETPVTRLVANTVYLVDPEWFVPLLGIFEVVVGIGLLLGRALRVVLLLFVAQMLGTFLVLVIQPEVAFQDGNRLLLTTEGEFVVKNLVLLSAGLVIGSHLRGIRPWKGEARTRHPDD